MTGKNGRVKIALLKNDLDHLKTEQKEMKGDIKDVKKCMGKEFKDLTKIFKISECKRQPKQLLTLPV